MSAGAAQNSALLPHSPLLVLLGEPHALSWLQHPDSLSRPFLSAPRWAERSSLVLPQGSTLPSSTWHIRVIHLFIQARVKYLFSTDSVPGTVLGAAGDREVTRQELCQMEAALQYVCLTLPRLDCTLHAGGGLASAIRMPRCAAGMQQWLTETPPFTPIRTG